ncbi:hypothetical protein ACIBCN_19415 [Nocardia sp. NPDC051052]|uniref:hypothetical protein n=1 Tax=Nocardia sp. NPDC051052 TaxID=3364322 RepID=UPI00379059A4
MSDLEDEAKRCLAPFMLGRPGTLEPGDAAPIAAWVQKTGLTAMLVSSEGERADGYGVPVTEYHALYELAAQSRPLPASRLWMGRYSGSQRFAVDVTPVAVRIDGIPEADVPQGYTTTIVLGQLILHGIRFTTTALEVETATDWQLPQFWPTTAPVAWPSGDPIDDIAFLDFARGMHLRSTEPDIAVRPWTPAVDLPRSGLSDGMIELPAPCGKHVVYYPAALAHNAFVRGDIYAFHLTCECPHSYLCRTLSDGTHFNAESKTPADIEVLYERLPGENLMIRDQHGVFAYKKLAAQPRNAKES